VSKFILTLQLQPAAQDEVFVLGAQADPGWIEFRKPENHAFFETINAGP